MSQSRRLRVGVIGCWGIAQMMHPPFLFNMPDQFELAALYDLSPGVLKSMGARYQVLALALFNKHENLVAQELDAVLVLSGGDHFRPAFAAIQAGKHAFVEKPLCFT